MSSTKSSQLSQIPNTFASSNLYQSFWHPTELKPLPRRRFCTLICVLIYADGRIYLRVLPWPYLSVHIFWNLIPDLSYYFLPLATRGSAKQRYVDAYIIIVENSIVWTYICTIFITNGLSWKIIYVFIYVPHIVSSGFDSHILRWENIPISGSNSTIMIPGAVLWWKWSILYGGRGDGDACHE